MPEDVLLGIDLGSSRTKVGLYTRNGVCVALVAVPTPRRRRDQHDDLPVLGMLDAVQAATGRLDISRRSVVGVGVATMGEVGTTLGEGGLRDLSFPAWYDERGADVVSDLVGTFGRRRLAGRTGRAARTTSSIGKLGWLQRHDADLSGTFLGIAAMLVWRLTGVVSQEPSLAATSGAYDPVRREYDMEIWTAAGLANLTPAPVREPGETAPVTTAEGARWLGLPAGIPVVIAGHDHPVAAVGAGARAGEVVDSMGTGEPLLCAWPVGRTLPSVDDVAAAAEQGLTLTAWPATGSLAVLWEGLLPGLAMENLAAHLGVDRAALDEDDKPPGCPATRLPQSAISALEEGRPLGTPLDRAAWVSLLDHYAGRAAEGERQLRSTTGSEGATILTGGGLRSASWLAAKRRAHWGSLHISTATETVVRGAAAITGTTIGWWSSSAEMPGATRKILNQPPFA